MQGERVADSEYPTEPGQYSKHILSDDSVVWICVVPTGRPAVRLGKPNKDGSPHHHIEEHEDGTISIMPQPSNSNSILWNNWHGYIDKGHWVPA